VGACIIAAGRAAERKGRHQQQKPGDYKTPVPLGDPGPDDFRTGVEAMANSSLPGSERVFANVRATAEGSRLSRALASPERVVRAASLNRTPARRRRSPINSKQPLRPFERQFAKRRAGQAGADSSGTGVGRARS
jgi:hypothetical protein